MTKLSRRLRMASTLAPTSMNVQREEAADMLDECEKALDEAVKFMRLHVTEVSEPIGMDRCVYALAKLRGEI